MLYINDDGSLSLTASTYFLIYLNGSSPQVYSGRFNEVDLSNYKAKCLDPKSSLSWLSEDGSKSYQISLSVTKNDTTSVAKADHVVQATLTTTNLGFNAIKAFGHENIGYLSEEYYLDNDRSKFPHGTIKDAWGSPMHCYVLTTDNQLYELVDGWSDNFSWGLLGTYDVKKITATEPESFMLTNDGELYQIRPSFCRVDGENAITRLYPDRYIVDFALNTDEGWASGYGNVYLVKNELRS